MAPARYNHLVSYEDAMTRALLMAHQCTKTHDVPVGAVVLDGRGKIVGKGWNRRVAADDPTAHAEIEALREAGRALGTWNLTGCTLVVTLEPCTMCAGAAVASRISRVVFGAWDTKAGACGSVRDVVRDARMNHQVEVISGLMEKEAQIQLKAFFAERRRASENPRSDFWTGRTPWNDPEVAASTTPTPVVEQAIPASASVDDTIVEPFPASPPTESAPRRRSDRHSGKIPVPPLNSAAWQ